MKKHNKFLYMLFSTILCFFVQTMVFSAINSTVKITGNAYARVDADVRITDFRVYSASPDSNSGYEEFSKNTISTNVILPYEDSTVTYVLEVTNYGDEAGIYFISGLPDYLDYEIRNYTLGDKLCSSDGQCSFGSISYIYLTIRWKFYEYENISNNIVLNFDFRNVYSITYKDMKNDNYPSIIMDGVDFNLTFTKDISNKINIYVDGTEFDRSTYVYNNSNGNLIFNDVSGDLIIEKAESTLLEGRVLTANVKNFIAGTTDATYSTEETTITYIGIYEDEIPYGYTKEEFFKLPSLSVSDDDRTKVYHDNDKIFFYSIDDIYAAESSYALFRAYVNLTELNITALDTSRVWSAQSMFDNLRSLKSIDLSNFDASYIGTAQSMFSGMTSLESIDLSKFNASNLRNITSMFNTCSSLKSINLSSFNTSKLDSMSSLFNGCTSLVNIIWGDFNTSLITDMTKIFYKCSSLINIDISNWDTSNVTLMERMFGHCSSLKNIYVGNGWNTSNVTFSERMFGDSYTVLNFDNKYTDVSRAFVGFKGYLTRKDFSNIEYKLNQFGGEVCIENECFNILNNDGTNVTLFAKYNLYAGGEYNDASDVYTSYGNEATGLQDPTMIAFKKEENDIRNGTISFSSSAYWIEEGNVYPKYVYNSNSDLYRHLENYKNYLNSTGTFVSNVRLISYDDLLNINYNETDFWSYVPAWAGTTSYWTGIAISDTQLYTVTVHPGVNQRNFDYKNSYGIRPVVEMTVSEIKKLLS